MCSVTSLAPVREIRAGRRSGDHRFPAARCAVGQSRPLYLGKSGLYVITRIMGSNLLDDAPVLLDVRVASCTDFNDGGRRVVGRGAVDISKCSDRLRVVVRDAEHLRRMLEPESVGCAEKSFKIFCSLGYGQEGEDAAAVIVDDDDYNRLLCGLHRGKAVDVMQQREVAE